MNDPISFVCFNRRYQLSPLSPPKACLFHATQIVAALSCKSLMDVVSTNIVTHTGCVGASTFWVVALKRDPSTGRAGG
jgi:hypothetical protein